MSIIIIDANSPIMVEKPVNHDKGVCHDVNMSKELKVTLPHSALKIYE
jgi:hypothetical protein